MIPSRWLSTYRICINGNIAVWAILGIPLLLDFDMTVSLFISGFIPIFTTIGIISYFKYRNEIFITGLVWILIYITVLITWVHGVIVDWDLSSYRHPLFHYIFVCLPIVGVLIFFHNVYMFLLANCRETTNIEVIDRKTN